MWFLNWLPDSILELIIYGILGVGFIATLVSLILINPLLRFMPGLAGSYRLIQVGSVAVFLLGVYLFGGYNTEMTWRERANELKHKAELAEADFKRTNAELSKAMAERDQAIKDKGNKIIERTTRYVQGDPVEIVKEVVKEKNLSDEERKKLEDQIRELQKAEKECPVPKLVIDSINEAARPPAKGDKK